MHEASSRTVAVQWDLFNAGTKALVEVLVAAPYEAGAEARVRAQIAGVSHIKLRLTSAGGLGGLHHRDFPDLWQGRQPWRSFLNEMAPMLIFGLPLLVAWLLQVSGLPAATSIVGFLVLLPVAGWAFVKFYPRGPYHHWLRRARLAVRDREAQ